MVHQKLLIYCFSLTEGVSITVIHIFKQICIHVKNHKSDFIGLVIRNVCMYACKYIYASIKIKLLQNVSVLVLNDFRTVLSPLKKPNNSICISSWKFAGRLLFNHLI